MNKNQKPHNTRNFMAKKNKIRSGNVGLLAGQYLPPKRERQGRPNISLSTTDRTPKIAALFRSRFQNTSSDFSKTPQSISSNTTDSDNSEMILAICEGRGEAREEVGMAALDLRRPELGIYQVSDTQGYTQTLAGINVLNPIEILVPLTMSDSRLVHILKQKFSTVTMNTIPRRLFDANMGLQLVHHLCAQIYANGLLDVQHKYYALAATSALINHLETYKHVAIATKSLKIIYLRTEHITAIDCDTAYRLELITPTRGTNKHSSLFGILNNTLTKGGKRFLRANILQPLCKHELIEERLRSVEELSNSPELLNSLQHILPKFINVDSILTICMKTPDLENSRNAEIQLNYILTLKVVLGAIAPLRDALTDIQTPALIKIKENLSSLTYKKLNDTVLHVIQKDAFPSKGRMGDMQRCFSIRPGINQLLDLTRKSYSELIDTARELLAELSAKLRLPLELNCNSNKGFHIVMKLAPHQRKMKKPDFPPEFINVTRHPTSFSMTTAKMVQLSKRLKNTQQEIELLSNREIFNALNEIREDISSLYMLCENIAELDLIQSLAETAKIPNYVKPTFSNNYLDVQASRHPMLEFLMENEPVANNIFMTKQHNFHIITGPNMSGKSIYIRQIVLLQIMAQIGSFVPAKSACFRITDRIFTRINFDDCIDCDASTFQLEIREMKVIIETLTPTSLVIIDELCRGTVHDEGTAIAWVLSEQFLNTAAFVFLTTHFLTLTKLEDMYLNVINWHMESSERKVGEEIRLSYTYRLVNGVTNLEKYGLAAARVSAMPKAVVTRASEIVDQLTPSVKPIQNIDKPNIIDRLKYNFNTKIEFLESTNQLTDVMLTNLLNDYNENLQKILTEQGLKYNSEIPNDLINVDRQIKNVRNNLAEIAQMDNTPDNVDLVEIEQLYNQIENPKEDLKTSQLSNLVFEATMKKFLECSEDDDIMSQESSLAHDYFNINTSSSTSKSNTRPLNCLDLVCANYSASSTSDTSQFIINPTPENSTIVNENVTNSSKQITKLSFSEFDNISTSDTSNSYYFRTPNISHTIQPSTSKEFNDIHTSEWNYNSDLKSSIFKEYYKISPPNSQSSTITNFTSISKPNLNNSFSNSVNQFENNSLNLNLMSGSFRNLKTNNKNLETISKPIFANNIPNQNDNQSILAPETTVFNTTSSFKSNFDLNLSNFENVDDEHQMKPYKFTFKNPSKSKTNYKKSNSTEKSNISNKLAAAFQIVNKFVEHTSTTSINNNSRTPTSTHLPSASVIPETEFTNSDKSIEFNLRPPQSISASSSVSHLFSDRNNEEYAQFLNNITEYKPNFKNTTFKYVFRSDANMTNKFF